MAQRSLPEDRKAQIAARVRLLRSLLSNSQVEMAARMGVSTQGWSHYEKGRSPPTDPVLRKLKDLHGVTRDYVMDGSLSGMPMDLVRQIENAEPPPMRANKRRA
jgi:transcriptional regulator with XRE-family HTH domain